MAQPTGEPAEQTEKGDYTVVTNMQDKDADEEQDRKESPEPKLSDQQLLYKWSRSGDSDKLKEFVRNNHKKVEMKTFLSLPDDGSSDPVVEEVQAKGCCAGDDDDDTFVRATYKPFRSGNTALHFAALHGNYQFCKDLHANEAQFTDQKNKLGSTPLHLAASSGDPKTLKFILEKYVSTNNQSALQEQNKIGNTPIHCAVYSNSVECVKLLLAACEKDDIDPKDALSQTNHIEVIALRYASSPEMKRYLNLVFNPDLADEDENEMKDNNDDEPAQNNTGGANGVVEEETNQSEHEA